MFQATQISLDLFLFWSNKTNELTFSFPNFCCVWFAFDYQCVFVTDKQKILQFLFLEQKNL